MKTSKILGLIGFPLEHSFSERYFNNRFREEGYTNVQYINFPLETVEEFPELLELEPNLCGLNVTSPHKKNIMKYLDSIEQCAQKIGAVNTITITRTEGKPVLKGYNTDAYGFEQSLMPLLESHHDKALVLGSGGAANAVTYVLSNLGINYKIVTRSPGKANELSYDELTEKELNEHKLIVNCTPLGMYPHTHLFPPIPYGYLTKEHLLYDLIYNPETTVFLQEGQKRGCKTKNGLEMLYLQAQKAWTIFRENKCF